MDDEEFEEFINSIESHKECKTLYVSHDVLPSTQQEQLLHKNGIEIKTIPEFFRIPKKAKVKSLQTL